MKCTAAFSLGLHCLQKYSQLGVSQIQRVIHIDSVTFQFKLVKYFVLFLYSSKGKHTVNGLFIHQTVYGPSILPSVYPSGFPVILVFWNSKQLQAGFQRNVMETFNITYHQRYVQLMFPKLCLFDKSAILYIPA